MKCRFCDDDKRIKTICSSCENYYKEDGKKIIAYDDLSNSLKFIVIFGYIVVALWVMIFSIGFIMGLIGG